MNTQTTKNYKTDNGDRTVIGGVLEFTEDAQVLNFPAGGAMRLGEGLKVGEDGSLSVSITPAANQSNCETTDITLLVQAFNQLLAGLKAVGLMEADPAGEPDTGGTDPVTEPTVPTDGNGDGNAAGNDTPAGGDGTDTDGGTTGG
jgi:hypothetical protein